MMNNTPKYYNKVCTYFVSQDIKYNWEDAFQIDFKNHLVFPSCAFYTLLDSKKNMYVPYIWQKNQIHTKSHIKFEKIYKNMSMRKMQTGYVDWSIYPNFHWVKTFFVDKNPIIPDCILHFLSYSPMISKSFNSLI